MTHPNGRRRFLTSSLAAGAAMALPLRGMAADTALEMVLITPSPAGDVGWSRTLLSGAEAVVAEHGDAVKLQFLESISEGPDADRVMNKAVAQGAKFVILGSFGYQNGGVQLAKKNPDVSVLHASGFEVTPNFSPFAAKYWQGTYLMGMAAAGLTKSKKLGMVGAFAIPELITSVNAFAMGARAVDPEITVANVWVNSWFDPAAEQNAAKALLAQGVDVIFSNAQDTPSVIGVAEDAGAYVFNLNSSMKSYAPKKYLGVVGTDWAPFFKTKVDAHLAGSFKGEFSWLGLADDVLFVADWSPDIAADAKAKIEAAEAAIRDGSLTVFAGPLMDASGKERVAKGAAMTDPEILAMDWHVAGITTPLPN